MLKTMRTGLGKKPALLVVDATIAFTSPDCPLGADFTSELNTIVQLLNHAREQGWPCVFTTVVYKNGQAASVFREKLPSLNLLTANAELVKLHPSLKTRPDDLILEKTHASAFFGTHLKAFLDQLRCDSVVVAGFTTSGCVRATAVDALQHNFRTIVVEDATGDRDEQAHLANLKDLNLKYADVLCLQELLEQHEEAPIIQSANG